MIGLDVKWRQGKERCPRRYLEMRSTVNPHTGGGEALSVLDAAFVMLMDQEGLESDRPWGQRCKQKSSN